MSAVTENEKRVLLGEGAFSNFPYSGCVYRTSEEHPRSIKQISAGGELLLRYPALVGIMHACPFPPPNNGREIELPFVSIAVYLPRVTDGRFRIRSDGGFVEKSGGFVVKSGARPPLCLTSRAALCIMNLSYEREVSLCFA